MEQQKDNNSKDKNIGQFNDFGFNRYVSLKNEKLTSALYMVTDFLSDNEPLKWTLRGKTLELTASINTVLKDNGSRLGLTNFDQILHAIDEIVSFLNVAVIGGAVSQMNFEILKQEYLSLKQIILDKVHQHSMQEYVNEVEQLASPETDSNSQRQTVQIMSDSKAQLPSSGREVDKGHQELAKDIKDKRQHGVTDSKKNGRKEQIISFIKDKGWMSINDIAKAISDCSLKTVQRELAELVDSGLLKKQGERRWSRYMMAA